MDLVELAPRVCPAGDFDDGSIFIEMLEASVGVGLERTVLAEASSPLRLSVQLSTRHKDVMELGLAMFRLDYLSCFLTILATVLVGRKSWTGLLISIVNSLIVCVIGFRTSQFGFIPANVICICVYAFSIPSWLKKTHTHRIRNQPRRGGLVPNSLVMSPICTGRAMTIGQGHLKLNSAARRGYDLLLVARNRVRMNDLAKKLATDTRRKVEILAADLTNSNDLTGPERILRDDSRVTLLVNNAGMGTAAPLLNSDVVDINRMITLNGGLIEVVK